jgi:hypothetical protein
MNRDYSIQTLSAKEESKTVSFFEYMVVAVLIIYAGNANTFVLYSGINQNIISFLIPVLLSFILVFRWQITFDQNFFLLLIGFGVYFIAVSIKFSGMQPAFLLGHIFLFFVVYTVIKALKSDFFKIYEWILYYLAIIALFMWSVQIALGGDTLYRIFASIPGIQPFSFVTGQGLTVVVYSVQPSAINLFHNFNLPRNCGFAWEPGGFSVYLCLAIFINLFITRDEKNHQIRFWILVAALLSTQSTTGYVMFIIIILFYYLNKSLKFKVLLLPLLVIALVYMLSLPFMTEKVIELLSKSLDIDQIIFNSFGRESNINPQRFESFIIAFRDFRHNPILGLGGHTEMSWLHLIGARVSTITGFGSLLANYGVVGFLFFMILTVRSSIFLSEYFNYRGKLFYFLLIFSISISYRVLWSPVVLCFWMFSFFTPRKINENDLPIQT